MPSNRPTGRVSECPRCDRRNVCKSQDRSREGPSRLLTRGSRRCLLLPLLPLALAQQPRHPGSRTGQDRNGTPLGLGCPECTEVGD